MRPIYFLFISVPLLLFGQQGKHINSDIWIIENPSALVIYNHYEQRMTEDEKSELAQHAAWSILDENYILSDQFTHAIKVGLNRDIFYLQTTEDGDLINENKAGKIEIVKKALIIGDTVQLKTAGRITIQVGDKFHSVSERMLLERLFQHRKRYYVRDIVGNVSGWIKNSSSKQWKAYLPDDSNLAFEKQLHLRVDKVFSNYNNRLDQLFVLLNDLYGISNPSPQWVAEKSPGHLTYTLSPKTYQNRFTESQTFLVQELKDLIYGSKYLLSYSNGQIIIYKSSQ